MFSKLILICLLSTSAFASYEQAEKTSGAHTIVELVKGGYYFSAVPLMKEYLVQHSALTSELEEAFDLIISATGVKPFESLPVKVLERSRSGNVRYVLAKRHLNTGHYKEALAELKRVNADHPAYPFIANMKGTIHSSLKNYDEALSQFKDCVRLSDKQAGKAKSIQQNAQFLVNRDYCLAGIARVQFSSGDYRKAENNYLDIQKSSPVWPEILFEEAWTSYYVKNYNRTLGKLVSYRAPVFDFIFKPEVDVLKALTYLKMCLYEDAKKTADTFYDELLTPSRQLRKFLLSRGKDYRYYYSLMADHESGKLSPLPIVDSVLKSIHKDQAFQEMKSALTSAIAEYQTISRKPASPFRKSLIRNIKTMVDEYRTILGAYIRAGLVGKYSELYSAFQDMSYIKLEVLAQRKERLYQTDTQPGQKRGDLKYIERNDKQYFWTFNGEFWADELGDYVFALRSEC
jgi:tetratricopeptide (TPR) repeat protein